MPSLWWTTVPNIGCLKGKQQPMKSHHFPEWVFYFSCKQWLSLCHLSESQLFCGGMSVSCENAQGSNVRWQAHGGGVSTAARLPQGCRPCDHIGVRKALELSVEETCLVRVLTCCIFSSRPTNHWLFVLLGKLDTLSPSRSCAVPLTVTSRYSIRCPLPLSHLARASSSPLFSACLSPYFLVIAN